MHLGWGVEQGEAGVEILGCRVMQYMCSVTFPDRLHTTTPTRDKGFTLWRTPMPAAWPAGENLPDQGPWALTCHMGFTPRIPSHFAPTLETTDWWGSNSGTLSKHLDFLLDWVKHQTSTSGVDYRHSKKTVGLPDQSV